MLLNELSKKEAYWRNPRFNLLGEYFQNDDEDSKYLWNVDKIIPDYTAQQPKRQISSDSPLWKPKIIIT